MSQYSLVFKQITKIFFLSCAKVYLKLHSIFRRISITCKNFIVLRLILENLLSLTFLVFPFAYLFSKLFQQTEKSTITFLTTHFPKKSITKSMQ